MTRDLRLTQLLWPVVGIVVALLGVALASERGVEPRWSPRVVLVLALCLRLLFLFRPPELSDDIYRYLWDGASTLDGRNPYALAPADISPSDPELLRLRALVNHPDLVTIYPPAAQLLFVVGRALSGGALGMKALLVVLDLASCLLMLRLLRRAELPAWRLALYAWHPLPILEIAASGHIDGAGVFTLLSAFALLATASPRARAVIASGAAFAAAVMTKLFPLALMPCLLALAARRDRAKVALFAAAALVITALLTLPFLPEIGNGVRTLSTYAHRWEFAGFAFRNLRRLLGEGAAARQLLAALFVLIAARQYRPLLRAHEDLAPAMRAVLRAAYGVSVAFLCLTPTLHAWYGLYLGALLPFAAGPAGLALSGSLFLGYQVLRRYAIDGQWVESDAVSTAIVLVPAITIIVARVIRARRAREGDATH